MGQRLLSTKERKAVEMNAIREMMSNSGVASAGSDIRAVVYPPFSALPHPPLARPRHSELQETVRPQLVAADSDSESDSTGARIEQRIAEEGRRSFEAGRQRGLHEGAVAEREEQQKTRSLADKQRGEQLAGLVRSFDQERDRYLQAVEHEVVDLALAIAARVLRREAQMDPLLLTGAVRVALGQLSETTKARLRVPATEFDLWKEAMEHIPNLAVKPTVVSDDSIQLGDCVVETELGSVDLGVRSQLGEIEKGFFDRTRRVASRSMQTGELSAADTRK
jgi:flagellar assembly protein FliH